MISKADFLRKVMSRAICRNRYWGNLFRIFWNLKFSKTDVTAKSCKEFYFLTICNRKSFAMTRASVYSFLRKAPYVPEKIVIVSDGSWDKEEGEKYFLSFFRGVDFVFDDWSQCSDYFQKKDYNLSIWAEKQIWGKKMAAILKYAEHKLVLFSDPDVLWYNTPIVETDFKEDFLLKLSVDNSHNYDTALVGYLKAEYLYDRIPVNCGVVLVKGDLYAKSPVLKEATRFEAGQPGNFAEQTVFALLQKEFGELWPEEVITAKIDDVLQAVFKKNDYPQCLIARHYLFFLKWIYWKDLLTNFK